MESEPVSTSPQPTNPMQPKSHVKLIEVVAVAVIAVVIGAFLVSALISQPSGESSWLFKGAYATYKGSTSLTSEDIGDYDFPMSFDFTVDFTVRQEVVNFNSTNVLVSTSFRMGSSFGGTSGETVEDASSIWVPLSQMGLMTAFEDVSLSKSYESTLYIAGLGTRTCMIYEYAISYEGLAMTVYVDKSIGWPLKMTVSTDEEQLGVGVDLDINLVETNIPALK